jgi:hypothetical protein
MDNQDPLNQKSERMEDEKAYLCGICFPAV